MLFKMPTFLTMLTNIVVLSNALAIEPKCLELLPPDVRSARIANLIDSNAKNPNLLYNNKLENFALEADLNKNFVTLQKKLKKFGNSFSRLAYDPRFIVHAEKVIDVLDSGFRPVSPHEMILKMRQQLNDHTAYRGMYLTDAQAKKIRKEGLSSHRSLFDKEATEMLEKALPMLLGPKFKLYGQNYSVQLMMHSGFDETKVSDFISITDYKLVAEATASLHREIGQLPGMKWRILEFKLPRFDVLDVFGPSGLLPPIPRKTLTGADGNWIVKSKTEETKYTTTDPGVERFVYYHIHSFEIKAIETVKEPAKLLMGR